MENLGSQTRGISDPIAIHCMHPSSPGDSTAALTPSAAVQVPFHEICEIFSYWLSHATELEFCERSISMLASFVAPSAWRFPFCLGTQIL